MSHDAAEHGIHIEGLDDGLDEDWEDKSETCVHVDVAHGRCVLPPEHEGDHEYPYDPLAE